MQVYVAMDEVLNLQEKDMIKPSKAPSYLQEPVTAYY
jgi:hypothetical protein